MFTRDSKPPRIDTLIGKAARVHGDIEFQGGLHLDGHISGGVRAVEAPDATLSVSATGSIEGPVDVANVRVEGNVYYGVIEMTLGAQIMGKLVRLAPKV